MRKRALKFGIFGIVFLLISFLGYNVASITKEQNAFKERIRDMPEFSYQTMDNTVFSKNNLAPHLPTVFIYFNSECHFCQYEAQDISDNKNELKNIQLIFVSTEPIEKIRAFSETYSLNNEKNITFLHDSTHHFSYQFNVTSTPFTLMYDVDQNLIKMHKGQLNAKGIIKTLNSIIDKKGSTID
ncbi:peroxiredoxin family protein [Leptobacterium sp. I13]|uniref:peroxiredoxin family protein n=1 Tax=Leptobacterium meishanense TaxID=3128904 RepID=UPI0030EBB9DE